MSQTPEPTTAAVAADRRVARSRAAVLDAGVELLVECGPNAVTVDAIVQRSGVAKTTIYRHWGSREDLVVDVIREVVKPTPALRADLPFEEALRTLMRASCAQAADDRLRRAFPALLLAKAQSQPALERLRDETQDDHHSRLEEILRRGVAEGHLRPDVTVQDAVIQLMAPMVLLTCGFQDLDDPATTAERIVDLFLSSHRP
jgi:AcrR family transcriptional regulator